MRTALITGSLGLVGSATMDILRQKGWRVVGIDNNGRSKMLGVAEQEYGDTLYLDFTNQGDVDDLFQSMKFDAVVHAGGQPSHDYATDHVLEDFHINATGTLHLLEATRKYCPDATFIHVSTDKVYGERMVAEPLEEKETRYDPVGATLSSRGFDEELGLDFAGDRSFFGCSKAAADMYAQQYAARGMTVGVFRPGCITGSNHQGAELHGFLAYLTKVIKHGGTYKIFGNGKQVRDQIHASDVAEAFSVFLERPESGVYNIGGGPERSVSVLEAIEMIKKQCAENDYDVSKFKYEFHPARLGDRKFDIHDVSKFRREYPEWDYKYSLEAIIKELCWDGIL